MKISFLLYFLLLHAAAFTQELIANGSFEDPNTCTEFIKECAPEAWISSSLINNYYFEDIRHAPDGVHFCAVITGNVIERRRDYHSFLYSRLLCGLRKGNHYRLSFKAWSKHAAFDSLGVYFSAGDFLYDKRTYKQIVPDLLLRDSAGSMADPEKWRQISFDYTATGQENYIVLGNFKRQPFFFGGPDNPDGSFYIFIDKVSMRPLDPHELICKLADSMKAAIYDENDRHNLLEKRRALYRNEPPPPVVRARPTIVQHVDTLLIPDVLFATGSSKLTKSSHKVLDSFCVALMSRLSDSLVIEGHTDSVGSLQYNSRLSADRAAAVEQYLRIKTLSKMPKVFTRYHAFLRPVASNATPEGRTRNRRVELFLYRQD